MNQRRLQFSLLWKILLSTSIALTLLFGLTGWLVQDQFGKITRQSIEEEVRQSFAAYQSLWQARANQLASVSLVISRMPDVRAAFGTRDRATIQDSAGEIWAKISQQDAFFLVTDPGGAVLARLGGKQALAGEVIALVPQASSRFPGQASGFVVQGDALYQIVLTPVYVDATRGVELLNVLVAGYSVDSGMANRLKTETGGSDFVFEANGKIAATTLSGASVPRQEDYSQVQTPLLDAQGKPVGKLHILRSLAATLQPIADLRQRMIGLWLLAVAGGLAVTYLLAKRILMPVQELDRAAAEIGRRNYAVRVTPRGHDELGRLAATFNEMAESIQTARQDLIRQERISTIGRLSTSIAHDLRNPLAAIYGGAELLIDHEDLPRDQVRRLAQNMYRSTRRVQDLLSELTDVTRGQTQAAEACSISEIVTAAADILNTQAKAHRVEIHNHVDKRIQAPLERSRMERVFENLFHNAIEAMPEGGKVDVYCRVENGSAIVEVKDTGPGIPAELNGRLFEPFATSGKKNGIGLGLALSRKTVVDHGGELWLDSNATTGARFLLKLRQ